MQKKKYLGQYEILEKVARGSGGTVYKVRHKELGQIYALKILQDDSQKDPDRILRFVQEAKTTARLNHPHLIQVVDAGQQKQHYYLVMEFIEGKTLEEHIREKIPVDVGLKWIKQVLSALDYAHQQGVIHRDIKPGNILITLQNDAKLGDFGLARDREFEQVEINSFQEVLGTPSYMSPEQAAGKVSEVDQTSDIYAVGACLYEICTGHRPFECDSLPRLLYQIIVDEPTPPSRWVPTISRDLERILLKAIRKAKRERYPSAQAFADDIERFLQGYPIQAHAGSSVDRLYKWSKRNPFFLGFSVLFLIGTLGIFFLFEWRSSHEYEHLGAEALLQAQHLMERSPKDSSLLFEEHLTVLNQINVALSFSPQNVLLQKAKWNLSQKLMPLACEKQQFHLADYLIQEIKTLSILSIEEKEECSAWMKAKQQERLKTQETRLDFWIRHFRAGTLTSEERESAIFEIAGMSEPEIQEKLLQIFQEGNRYFLGTSETSARNEALYKTVVQILGRFESPELGSLLFATLEQMNDSLQPLPMRLRPISKIQYMVVLTQAISHHQLPGVALKLKKIRRQSVKSSFYSEATALAYKTLAELDGLHRVPATTPEELCQRGGSKFDQKDWNGAIQDYTEALRLDSKFVDAWKSRAVAEAKRENWSASIADATQALQLNPNQAVVYSNRGTAKQMLNDLNGALEDFNRAIQLDSELDKAHGCLGMVYLQLGNYAESLKCFNKALDLDPYDVNHYFDRGQLKHLIGDLSGALKDYDSALQLDPECTRALLQRSQIKESLADLGGALQDLDRVLIQDPKSYGAYLYRAQIKKSQGDSIGAIRDYQESIRTQPEKNKIPYYRGLIKELQKDVVGALQEYTQAIQLNPQEATYYNYRGLIYKRLRYWKEAFDDFTKAIECSTAQKDIYYSHRAQLQSEHGQWNEAIQDYTQAIQWCPFEGEHYFDRGQIRYAFDDFKGALEDYYCALYFHYKVEILYYLLGLTYEKRKEHASARESFLRFLLITESTSDVEIQHLRQEVQQKIHSFFQESEPLIVRLKNAYRLAEQGFQQEQEGQYALALNHYQNALQVDPKNPLFLFKICKIYHTLSSWNRLIPIVEKELSQRFDPALLFLLLDGYLGRGTQFLEQQNWTSAKTDFLRYQQWAPENHHAQKQVQLWLSEIAKHK